MNIRGVLKHGFAVVAAAALVLPLSAAGAAPGALEGVTRVSQDKIVDGFALHRSEVQPSLAAGTSKTVVGAFEVGRIFNGGSSAVGWATSADGGNAWHDGLLPLTIGAGQSTTGAGTLWRAADPSAAYNESHNTWLIASTGLNGTGGAVGLFVNSSKNGEKWSAPVVAHAAGTGDAPQNGALACDNSPQSKGYGTCYIAYNNAGSTPANQLAVVTSTDGGATWSAPVGTPDASVGTGVVTLVQPPPPGAAAGTTCGRVVVAYASGTTIDDVVSTDCGATWSAHAVVTSTFAATHSVAQTVRTGLVPSAAIDRSGAIYLTWQTRSFRIAQTTLAAAANAGDTNIKVGSVTGMVAGNTLTIDPTGSNPEAVTISAVGTAGATGTGVTISPPLAFAHASGSAVSVNGIFSTSTAAPNDLALSVMPGPTDATPAPTFGAPSRVPIEADNGALSNTVDHFIPGIAADPNAAGRVALFYYFYPLAACDYVDTDVTARCSPRVGYVSSTDGGGTWSASQSLTPGPPSLAVYVRTLALGGNGNGGPDLGSVLGAVVAPGGPNAGKALALLPVGIPVNGTDESMYVPKSGLTIGGGS